MFNVLPVTEEEDACSGFEKDLNDDMTEMVCNHRKHFSLCLLLYHMLAFERMNVKLIKWFFLIENGLRF